MKVLLNCTEVAKGMFPQEKLVVFETTHDKHVELFVHHSLISDGKLEVELAAANKRTGVATVSLPYAPINTSSYVGVRLEQLFGLPPELR
jgi:hypothetical protein